MKKQNTLNFLGIGAQKSGTSWLYHNLKQIPEFDLLPIKELHYFDRSPNYPSSNVLSKSHIVNRINQKKYLLKACRIIFSKILKLDWKAARFYWKWYFSHYCDQWYLSLFKNFRGFTGEFTPSYSMLKLEDIKRMHTIVPDVKLILILRNPIERAWSNYRFRSSSKLQYERKNYSEIIEFMDSNIQTMRSNYLQTIDDYSKIFQRQQLLICFYDAILDDPDTLIKDIVKHICGDKNIVTTQLNLKTVVKKSRQMVIPIEIEDYLKEKYHDQIKELSDRYGGYCLKWYQKYYTTEPSK